MYGQENCVRKYSRIRVTGIIKSTLGGECKKNSEVLRADRGTKEDPTSSSRNRRREGI